MGLERAFFLCQTVFWHDPYPHILPTEHGHEVWQSLKVLHRGAKKLSHASPIHKLLTPPLSAAVACVTTYCQAAVVMTSTLQLILNEKELWSLSYCQVDVIVQDCRASWFDITLMTLVTFHLEPIEGSISTARCDVHPY